MKKRYSDPVCESSRAGLVQYVLFILCDAVPGMAFEKTTEAREAPEPEGIGDVCGRICSQHLSRPFHELACNDVPDVYTKFFSAESIQCLIRASSIFEMSHQSSIVAAR